MYNNSLICLLKITSSIVTLLFQTFYPNYQLNFVQNVNKINTTPHTFTCPQLSNPETVSKSKEIFGKYFPLNDLGKRNLE